MHVAVHRVEEVFFPVYSLPAKEHSAVLVKIVCLFVDRLEAGLPHAVLVEIVGVAADLLKLIRDEGAVGIAVLVTFGGLHELGCEFVALGQSCAGVGRRNGRSRLLHCRRDVVIQGVVKLIGHPVDDISAAVLDTGDHGAHVSLACDAYMSGFHAESDHAVISAAVDIAEVFEIIDGCLYPSAREGRLTVTVPVVVGKRGVDFLHKCFGIAGVAAVVVHFEDIRPDIDTAVDELVLSLFFDIAAGEIGDTSGSDLGHQ